MELADTLDRVVAAFQRQVVIKNIICGLQADYLTRLNSNSICSNRAQSESVAKSLLRVQQRYGDNRLVVAAKHVP